MAASEHLSGFQFAKAEPRSMDGPRFHQLDAVDHEGNQLGRVQWSPKTGEVHNIQVHPEHRRQGIGTALWSHANQVASETRGVKPPRHSPERTDDGQAWASSVSNRLPRRA